MIDLAKQALEALEPFTRVKGLNAPGISPAVMSDYVDAATAAIAALRSYVEAQPAVGELTDEEISRIAKTLPLEGCDKQKMGWGIGYSKESDFLEPNLPRAVFPFARAVLAAYLRKHGEPEYWQWRRKSQPWSLDKTFNSRVYATADDSEVRPLYAAPPLTDQERQDAARWRAIPAFLEKHQIDYVQLLRDVDGYITAAMSKEPSPSTPLHLQPRHRSQFHGPGSVWRQDMSEKPNALRLADALIEQAGDHYEVAHDCDCPPEATRNWQHYKTNAHAAAELRRLHAENEATRADIERYVRIASELGEAREQDRRAMREALEALNSHHTEHISDPGRHFARGAYDLAAIEAAIVSIEQRLGE